MSDLYPEEEIDENDKYLKMVQFQSLRNENGLEEAISVCWDKGPPLKISTLLEPDDLAPLFDGAQWAGTRVWHAAICAIEYLSRHYAMDLQDGATLIELGCGLGVPGMIAHQLGARNVCLTDQESIMSQLSKNVQSNFGSSTEIQAKPLNWSRQGVQQLLRQTKTESGYDICLNCDCVYEPLYGKSWELLVQVMDELLRVNPHTIMLTSVERREADGIEKFVQRLQDSSHVANVELVFSDAQYKIEIYMAKGKR